MVVEHSSRWQPTMPSFKPKGGIRKRSIPTPVSGWPSLSRMGGGTPTRPRLSRFHPRKQRAYASCGETDGTTRRTRSVSAKAATEGIIDNRKQTQLPARKVVVKTSMDQTSRTIFSTRPSLCYKRNLRQSQKYHVESLSLTLDCRGEKAGSRRCCGKPVGRSRKPVLFHIEMTVRCR